METTESVRTSTHDERPADMGRKTISRRGMLIRTIVGVTFEYYDFVIFATMIPFFAHHFFPDSDPTAAALSALVVFAVGFVARPFGAVLLGWLADRIGRKAVMVASMLLIASSSLLIAVLPTFETIGIAAAFALTAARLIQGFAYGGEAMSAYAFVAESAPKEKRGLYSSLYPFAQMSGILLATLFGAVLTTVLSAESMDQWGWRIPFFVGAVFGLFALVLRRDLQESEAFENARQEQPHLDASSYVRIIWQYRGSVARIFFLTAGMAVCYYTWAVNATAYSISSHGASPTTAFWVGVVAQVIYLCALPFWGAFSDRFGRHRNYMIAGGGLALVSAPLMSLLGPSAWQMLIPMTIGLLLLGAATSAEAAYMSELVPTRVRATALAIPLSIAVGAFGGTAPYLNTWLTSTGNAWIFIVYVVVMASITFIAALTSPRVTGRDFTRETLTMEPTPR